MQIIIIHTRLLELSFVRKIIFNLESVKNYNLSQPWTTNTTF